MHIEELAAGIFQISNQGDWNMASWAEARQAIETYITSHEEPVYLLINLRGTFQLVPDAFRGLVTAPYYNRPDVGLAILVGRQGQLQEARAILEADPALRTSTQLRLMTELEGAFQVLLDRQVMDRLQGFQRYGG